MNDQDQLQDEFVDKVRLYRQKLNELEEMQVELYQQAMEKHKLSSLQEARKKINEIT